jgi:hypothetical protein
MPVVLISPDPPNACARYPCLALIIVHVRALYGLVGPCLKDSIVRIILSYACSAWVHGMIIVCNIVVVWGDILYIQGM